MQNHDIAIIGLGVMGKNLALNMERNGFRVVGFDRDPEKRILAVEHFQNHNIVVASSLQELLQQLQPPKRIMMMIPAGKAVDAVITDLKPYLQPGDVIVDGGNSHFVDTERRWNELKREGIFFIGTGVSGGEEGALWGPSIMPGGDARAWPLVQPIFQAIAAKTKTGEPCCDWVGPGGAGHFVKMVHNGIEYADMQMICEAYFMMERALGLTAEEMSTVFDRWNGGELNSYLIEITVKIMAKKDQKTGKPMIDVILDTAGQKGTGKWTSQIALDLGIPAPTIAEAVFARTVSALKEERVMASKILKGPSPSFSGVKDAFVEKIRQALYAAKICAYAQGFHLMRAASEEYGWNLQFRQIAGLWRAGCIIRARLLDRIRDAYQRNPKLANLLLDDYFAGVIEKSQLAWREVVAKAMTWGIPTTAFSSALAYYDSYRCERLPANLLQAQRDFFGAHTYERVDAPRGTFFHTNWQEEA